MVGSSGAETGNLLRDGAVFYLRRHPGGRYQLRRTLVDLFKKRIAWSVRLLAGTSSMPMPVALPGLIFWIAIRSCSYGRSYDYTLFAASSVVLSGIRKPPSSVDRAAYNSTLRSRSHVSESIDRV